MVRTGTAVVNFFVISRVSISVLAQPPGGLYTRVVGQPLTNASIDTGLGGITFHVALHQEHPFVFYDKSKSGNARFSGISVDIIAFLAKDLDFSYVFSIDETAPESAEKALEAIGAGAAPGTVVNADVAAGAIHITQERIEDVSFSHAYFDTGYVVVVQRPPDTSSIWAFFAPFSLDLWVAVIVELLIVGALFFLMEAPFLTVQEGGDSDVVGGLAWAMLDALYWSVSALTCTLDKAPRTWAGKMVMLAHGWFFLIITASYTANLASSLTSASLAPSISSWNDVTAAGQKNKIALPRGFSHADFLGFEGKHHGFQFDVDYYDTYQQALQATIDGTSALTFHDEAVVQYYLINDMQKLPNAADRCSLLTVGSRFAAVGYGFAFNRDSLYPIPFSQGIIRLKEQGEVEKIMLKYGVGAKAAAQIGALCPLSSNTVELFFKDFHGLSIMIGVICGIALIVMTLSKTVCNNNTPASEPHAVAPQAATVLAATRSMDSDAGLDIAVHAGMRAVMGSDAAATSTSPAVQAYKEGVEIGVRAGLRSMQETGGLAARDAPVGAPVQVGGSRVNNGYQARGSPAVPVGAPSLAGPNGWNGDHVQPVTLPVLPGLGQTETNNASWLTYPSHLLVPPQQAPNSIFPSGQALPAYYRQNQLTPNGQPPLWQA